MRYINFSGGQQYDLADSRAEIESCLLPTALTLGPTSFIPGQLVDFPYFVRPLLYVGAEARTGAQAHSMYFYVGNTADGQKEDLFGKPAGLSVYMVLNWISANRFLVMGAAGSGRDYRFIKETWDWERGPGTALGGRHQWQGQE